VSGGGGDFSESLRVLHKKKKLAKDIIIYGKKYSKIKVCITNKNP